jgi:hypothetical protein
VGSGKSKTVMEICAFMLFADEAAMQGGRMDPQMLRACMIVWSIWEQAPEIVELLTNLVERVSLHGCMVVVSIEAPAGDAIYVSHQISHTHYCTKQFIHSLHTTNHHHRYNTRTITSTDVVAQDFYRDIHPRTNGASLELQDDGRSRGEVRWKKQGHANPDGEIFQPSSCQPHLCCRRK